jgi:Flp pilus assembly pilin Flp
MVRFVRTEDGATRVLLGMISVAALLNRLTIPRKPKK